MSNCTQYKDKASSLYLEALKVLSRLTDFNNTSMVHDTLLSIHMRHNLQQQYWNASSKFVAYSILNYEYKWVVNANVTNVSNIFKYSTSAVVVQRLLNIIHPALQAYCIRCRSGKTLSSQLFRLNPHMEIKVYTKLRNLYHVYTNGNVFPPTRLSIQRVDPQHQVPLVYYTYIELRSKTYNILYKWMHNQTIEICLSYLYFNS